MTEMHTTPTQRWLCAAGERCCQLFPRVLGLSARWQFHIKHSVYLVQSLERFAFQFKVPQAPKDLARYCIAFMVGSYAACLDFDNMSRILSDVGMPACIITLLMYHIVALFKIRCCKKACRCAA